MKLNTINTGYFKLDGGAMFGVVPKTLWSKINTPDENNLCNWALRCLMVETDNRLILIDCGLGNKQSEKFFKHYQPHGNDTLEKSIQVAGFSLNDVTDVFLTHLHFDHCGGAIRFDENKKLITVFKNANYWSNEQHWNWAINPNAREKASFLKENILPIQESGQLKFIEVKEGIELIPGFRVGFVYGHTEAMMIPHIDYKGKTIVYMADLLPSVGHIPLPYIMGYDMRPMETLSEKTTFLNKAVEKNYILFFEHDKDNECCTLIKTEAGVRKDKTMKLDEII